MQTQRTAGGSEPHEPTLRKQVWQVAERTASEVALELLGASIDAALDGWARPSDVLKLVEDRIAVRARAVRLASGGES